MWFITKNLICANLSHLILFGFAFWQTNFRYIDTYYIVKVDTLNIWWYKVVIHCTFYFKYHFIYLSIGKAERHLHWNGYLRGRPNLWEVLAHMTIFSSPTIRSTSCAVELRLMDATIQDNFGSGTSKVRYQYRQPMGRKISQCILFGSFSFLKF